jgi:DNA-directed RNA polymerase subunit RPC12/RpoP
MSVRFRCRGCKVKLKAKDRVAGKQVTCPRCSKRVWVPLESTAAAVETRETPKRRRPVPKSADGDTPSDDSEASKPQSTATTGFFDWLFSSLFGKQEVPPHTSSDTSDKERDEHDEDDEHEEHDDRDQQPEDPVFVPLGVSSSATTTAPEDDDEVFTPLGMVEKPAPPKTDKMNGSKSSGGLCWSCGSSPCEC